MKKRQILAALLFALLLLQTTACGGDTVTPETDAAETAVQTETETTSAYPDDLPEDLKFGGETVTFLYRDEVSNEFFTEALNGDVVNDAQYNSILSTEERLEVDIALATRPGHLTSVRQEYMNHIINSIQAGDDVYDWVDLMIGNSPVLMRDGLFLDVLQNCYDRFITSLGSNNLIDFLI